MSVNNISSRVRISGLASGLDTDKMVSDLMKVQQFPITKLKQDRQVAQWKQDSYREITSSLSDFNKSYMDVVNFSNNMRSESQYKKFTTGVTNTAGTASSSLSVSGTSSAQAGTHSVSINRLATSASETSASAVTSAVQSADLRGNLAVSGKSFNLTLDGVTKQIAFNTDFDITDKASGDAFAASLQSQITNAFGTGLNSLPKVAVSYDETSGKISFNTSNGANKLTALSSSTSDALSTLGISSGTSNRINTSKTLNDLKSSFGVNGGLTFYDDAGVNKIKFTINTKEFTFTADTKLADMLNTINNDTTAKVNVSYDTISDKFSIKSKQSGSGKNIEITNTWGNFLGANSATGIDSSVSGFGTNGQDAIINIDGKDIVRSNNTFTEEGITYNLLKAEVGDVKTVTLTSDTSAIFDGINNFFKKYNEVIDKINTKLNENHDKIYVPLTDDQKSAMKDTDITAWETQAKTGLLKNDPTLSTIVSNMRMALLDSVTGVGKSLYNIGIRSTSYSDRGKVSVDEAALKQAIQSDPDGVMNLFSQKSTTAPDYSRTATASEKSARYKEEGVVNRLYDIVQDNISILKDSYGQKGSLLSKAGLSTDTSDTSSFMAKKILEYNNKITKLEDKLSAKEEEYYKKFTAMETAMSKLNSQTSQLGSLFASS